MYSRGARQRVVQTFKISQVGFEKYLPTNNFLGGHMEQHSNCVFKFSCLFHLSFFMVFELIICKQSFWSRGISETYGFTLVRPSGFSEKSAHQIFLIFLMNL